MTCHHYGARPRNFCYCGAMVSASDWAEAQRERAKIRAYHGQGWKIVRDETGQAQSMVWVP